MKPRAACMICGDPGTQGVRVYVPRGPVAGEHVPCDQVLARQRLCEVHAVPQPAPPQFVERLHETLRNIHEAMAEEVRQRGLPVPPALAEFEGVLDFERATLIPLAPDHPDALAAELHLAGFHG